MMQELPSEGAQHLAEFLNFNSEYFSEITLYGRVVFDTTKLSETIQNYWDSQL